SVSKVQHDREITQGRPGLLGDGVRQNDIRNLGGIDVTFGIVGLLARVRKGGHGNIVAGERVVGSLDIWDAIAVHRQRAPTSWFASVRKVVDACVVGVVGVWRAIRIDRHPFFEEESRAIGDVPYGYVLVALVLDPFKAEEERPGAGRPRI